MDNWLTCTVSDGMFPGEKAIEVESYDKTVSFFLFDENNEVIRNNGDRKEIRVTVLDYDSEHALVSLPRETIEGSNIIKVRKVYLRDDPVKH